MCAVALDPGGRDAPSSGPEHTPTLRSPAHSPPHPPYHPEVNHTEGGADTLRHFLLDIAGVKPDWTMAEVLETQLNMIREQARPA